MSSFDIEKSLADQYSQNAKTYIQLSIASLALSIVFVEDILGSSPKVDLSVSLFLVWFFFLITAVLGVSYQYLSIRWLEFIADRENLLFKDVKRSKFFQPLVESCSKVYILYFNI